MGAPVSNAEPESIDVEPEPINVESQSINVDPEFASVVMLEVSDEHSNYEAWLASITDYCQTHGLLGYLNGTAVEPKFNGRSRKGTRKARIEAWMVLYEPWAMGERKVDSLIKCTSRSARYVWGTPTIRKMLRDIEQYACFSPLSQRTAAMHTFLNLKPGDSVRSFFADLDACFAKLTKCGVDMSDEIRVPLVLAKLSKGRPGLREFIDMESRWRSDGTDGVSYNDLVHICLSHENHIAWLMGQIGLDKH